MFPEHLIFLDLETTGGNSLRDRITEIGLCEVHNGELVKEWSTLINPGTPISPFIEKLTGITSAMVAEAPCFSEIAKELREKLSGKLLVAHNARFDYGFLKNEFRRQRIDFHEKTLCTVKLSRTLYPEYKRHNLDEIIKRHNLTVQNRHRALGDAQLIQQFFEKVSVEHSPEILSKAIQEQLKQPSLPPHIPREQLENLPYSPGIYLFYGENDAVLYVGKSVNIHSRVRSHFSSDHRLRKGMRLSQEVRRIDFIETAGELGALLLEARLIKELAPIHNRQLRRTRDLFSICLKTNIDGVSQVKVVSLNRVDGVKRNVLFGTFRSKRQAETVLKEIILSQGLCNKVLGLEKSSGACFGYQIKKCRGACVGKEPLSLHEIRLTNALADLKLRAWPFQSVVGIREMSHDGDKTEIHVFDQWRHLGTASNDEELWEILSEPTTLPFDLDSYKILTRYFAKKKKHFSFVDLSYRQSE